MKSFKEYLNESLTESVQLDDFESKVVDAVAKAINDTKSFFKVDPKKANIAKAGERFIYVKFDGVKTNPKLTNPRSHFKSYILAVRIELRGIGFKTATISFKISPQFDDELGVTAFKTKNEDGTNEHALDLLASNLEIDLKHFGYKVERNPKIRKTDASAAILINASHKVEA